MEALLGQIPQARFGFRKAGPGLRVWLSWWFSPTVHEATALTERGGAPRNLGI